MVSERNVTGENMRNPNRHKAIKIEKFAFYTQDFDCTYNGF